MQGMMRLFLFAVLAFSALPSPAHDVGETPDGKYIVVNYGVTKPLAKGARPGRLTETDRKIHVIDTATGESKHWVYEKVARDGVTQSAVWGTIDSMRVINDTDVLLQSTAWPERSATFEIASGKKIKSYDKPAIASVDGKFVYTLGETAKYSGDYRLFREEYPSGSPDSGTPIPKDEFDAVSLRTFQVGGDGKTLLTVSMNGKLVVYDLVAGKVSSSYKPGSDFRYASLSADGSLLLLGTGGHEGSDDLLTLYATATGRKLARFEPDEFNNRVGFTNARFTPDGQKILLSTMYKFYVLDLELKALSNTPAGQQHEFGTRDQYGHVSIEHRSVDAPRLWDNFSFTSDANHIVIVRRPGYKPDPLVSRIVLKGVEPERAFGFRH